MRVGSLFTGYGGLDMVAEQFFDAATVWACDNDPGASKIIAHRYPGIPNLGDITAVNWTQVEPIDILTGGWPCQPFSHAGKRRGAADERALWPEVARAVRALRPRHVVLENVAAIASAGELARAVGDLASLGYVGSWRSLRAADVGAPHGRLRTFILAADAGRLRGQQRRLPTPGQTQRGGPLTVPGVRRRESAADAASNGWDEGRPEPARLIRGSDATERGAVDWGVYAPAIGRWEQVLGRPAPAPTEAGPKGGQRLAPRFVEWMQGLPDGWVTDVPGLSRNAQLKALGNGVVPQQANAALQLLTEAKAAA